MDDELARLERAYAEALDAYARVLQRLGDVRTIGTTDKYDAAFRATREARELLGNARWALDNYRAGASS